MAVLVTLVAFISVTSVPSRCLALTLAQASSGRVCRAADGFSRHEEFHSPVLLSTSRVLVGGYWQAVAEASG